MKALQVVRSSGGPRKDFARCRIPSRRLALEARFELWLSQERSSLIVRPRSLKELYIFLCETLYTSPEHFCTVHVPREGEVPKPTSTNQGRQGKEGGSMEGGEGVGL